MTAARGFDLRERPWIPVREGTERRRAGLRELFLRAHELTDVEVPLSPGAAGLWRVLYLIAGRVSGLDDPDLGADAFQDRRYDLLDTGRFDEGQVEAYFDRYADRFDLFDQHRPWMQDPRLADECEKGSGVNKVTFGRPAGNNQVWFGHHTDLAPRPVDAAEAAWHLVANLYYGPSGQCTTRTIGSFSKRNTTSGPLRGALSCHPLGATVFHSLVAGVPVLAERDRLATSSGAVDETPWEWADLPNPRKPPPKLAGLARLLVGRVQHAVLLTPDESGERVVDARLTWAFEDKFPWLKDPYLIYQQNKAGEEYPRPASLERALWRDLDALLMNSVGEEKHTRPAVFDHLPEELVESLRVRVYGFDQDGQTRDKQFFTQATPAVLGWLDGRPDSPAAQISATRVAAENVGRSLVGALKAAWSDVAKADKQKSPGPWSGAAEARYWPAAGEVFWRIVLAGDFDDPSRQFVKLALRVYDEIAGEVVSKAHWRMTRALAEHRRRIHGFAPVTRKDAA